MGHWLFHKSVAGAHWEVDSPEGRLFLSGALGFVSVCGQRSTGVKKKHPYRFGHQQVFMLCCDTEQNHSRSPWIESISRGPTKCSWQSKIHSLGFIRWSGLAKAPKTNIGLRSGIRDGQVPGTHQTVGRTPGDNRSEADLKVSKLSAQQLKMILKDWHRMPKT